MLEKGERQLTLRYAERIEAVYHVSADWLLYGDEESKNFPCGQSMIQYLKRHEELRKKIWSEMEKDNCLNTEMRT